MSNAYKMVDFDNRGDRGLVRAGQCELSLGFSSEVCRS